MIISIISQSIIIHDNALMIYCDMKFLISPIIIAKVATCWNLNILYMAHKEPMIQKAASLKNGNDVHTYEDSYKNKH